MFMSGSDTYFLKVSVNFSLNVAAEVSLRIKKIRKCSIFKAIFSKVKAEEWDQKD